jgi:hypothetical protein
MQRLEHLLERLVFAAAGCWRHSMSELAGHAPLLFPSVKELTKLLPRVASC